MHICTWSGIRCPLQSHFEWDSFGKARTSKSSFQVQGFPSSNLTDSNQWLTQNRVSGQTGSGQIRISQAFCRSKSKLSVAFPPRQPYTQEDKSVWSVQLKSLNVAACVLVGLMVIVQPAKSAPILYAGA